MRTRSLLTLATFAALALAAPAASAAPALCAADAVQQTLITAGKLTQEDVDGGVVVSLVRCGDVTADGGADAVFTLASGGTAGDTQFGVLRGAADGATGTVILLKQGYKIGIARHNSRSFDVIQPHYGPNEPNCCPGSFRVRRYTWTGHRFKTGKAKKRRTAPARFYKP